VSARNITPDDAIAPPNGLPHDVGPFARNFFDESTGLMARDERYWRPIALPVPAMNVRAAQRRGRYAHQQRARVQIREWDALDFQRFIEADDNRGLGVSHLQNRPDYPRSSWCAIGRCAHLFEDVIALKCPWGITK
jgi:hypothetical protein